MAAWWVFVSKNASSKSSIDRGVYESTCNLLRIVAAICQGLQESRSIMCGYSPASELNFQVERRVPMAHSRPARSEHGAKLLVLDTAADRFAHA
jgi:hypothetical protein